MAIGSAWKAKEYIENMIDTVRLSPDGEIAVEAALECVNEHIRRTKYRWHDIKRDPKDIPPEGFEGNVLISINGSRNGTHYIHAVGICYWCGKEYGFFEDEMMDKLIEAWRYIEGFDGDESDYNVDEEVTVKNAKPVYSYDAAAFVCGACGMGISKLYKACPWCGNMINWEDWE